MLSAQLIASLAPEATVAAGLSPAAGVSFHSDRVRLGDAFFALPGARTHGIAYADAALEKGAVFIVSDRPHPRGVQLPDPAKVLLQLGRVARGQLQGPVIAITGSAGKTSTKAMVAASLGATAGPGNFNTPLALSKVLVDEWLSGRVSPDHKLVLELGIDHIGEMDTLIDLVQPSHAVLTLIAASHLSGLGDVATVAREKLVLVDASPSAFVSAEAAPYLNPKQWEKSRIYGLEGDPEAEIVGRVSSASATGQYLEVLGARVRLPYPGAAMARNAVAALGVAAHFGLPLKEAAGRLEGLRLEPGRLEVQSLGPLTLINDSYNSNLASARAALEVLNAFPGPRTAILGSMLELGEASEALHRELGKATRELERVITIGDEARFIAAENPRARHFESLEAAGRHLQRTSLTGTVLLKGSRGMRLERLIPLLKEVVA